MGRSTPLSSYGLAFETSGAMGSIALGHGERIVDTRRLSDPRRYAVEFLPAAEVLLSSHSVDPGCVRSVYVSGGPGSFTGLRIGITAARMINLANGASLVPVPTLEVIAQNALRVDPATALGHASTGRRAEDTAERPDKREPHGAGLAGVPGRVAVLLDAKRQRVYAGAFVRSGSRYVPVADAVEADPAQFLAQQAKSDAACAVLGEGVLYHRAVVEASGLRVLPGSLYPPLAETVYRLGLLYSNEGRIVGRGTLVPTYIRPPEAEERWEQRTKQGRS